MITAADKANLADLSMRALDKIIEGYGEDAELLGASLVYEVRVPADNEEGLTYHGNYESLSRMSPAYAGGLHQQMAHWLLSDLADPPEEGD